MSKGYGPMPPGMPKPEFILRMLVLNFVVTLIFGGEVGARMIIACVVAALAEYLFAWQLFKWVVRRGKR